MGGHLIVVVLVFYLLVEVNVVVEVIVIGVVPSFHSSAASMKLSTNATPLVGVTRNDP